MTFIKGEPAADVLLTAVLHKYLNDELKYFVCYNFFLRLHRIPRIPDFFPCSEKSLSIPGFQVCGYPVGHFRDQSFQAINSTGTDYQNHNNPEKVYQKTQN